MYSIRVFLLILLMILIFFRPVHSIFITDLIGFGKMAVEYSRHLKTLRKILETSEKLKKDFEEFKGRFAKIHSGLKREALDILLTFKDIEFYFKSPYVRISKDDTWKEVWEDTKNLFRKLPFLKDRTALKESEIYKKNKEFRKRADFRIGREEAVYAEYEKALEMIADTRRVISDGAGKYKRIESLIREFTTRRATGKLIGLLCRLKLDQLVKMDLLITSIRMKMELELKEQILRIDTAGKREIEIFQDRERAKKNLQSGVWK